MSDELEPILEWNMPPLEAKAYKVCLLWLEISRKAFPNYKHSNRLPKKGDPRKCNLFKFAYKLVREVQGLLSDTDYRLYIKAQMDMLKAINIGNTHPLIDVRCLCGDKAWVRWKMWKRKYDRIKTNSSEIDLDSFTSKEICQALEKTKKFLISRLGENYKEDDIKNSTKDLERWVSLGKVSPFYVMLSSWALKYYKSDQIDLTLHKKSLTQEIKDCFDEIFDCEGLI